MSRLSATLLLCPILLAGLAFRLVWLGDPFYRTHHWNEGHYACTTLNFSRRGPLDPRNDLGRDRSFSPLVPLMLYPTALAAGWRPWGFRLPLALLGVAALGLFYSLMVWRWGCPRRAALTALCFASTAPGIVYYSRNIQLDGPATALLLAAAWLVSSRRRAARPWGWAAWALCVLAKTSFAAAAPALVLARAGARPGDWRRPRVWLAACVCAALGLVPVALWQASAGVADPGTSSEFLFRFSEWSGAAIVRALRETPDFFIRDFGWPGLLCAMAGICFIFYSAFRMPHATFVRRRAAPLALFLFWIVFIFTHPAAYTANRYYIFPGLFGLCLLAGWGVERVLQAVTQRAEARTPNNIWYGVLILILLFNGLLYPAAYGRIRLKGPAADAARAGEDPFAGVARLADFQLSKPALVDYPSTMFYAGGDPARVECAYGDVAARFDPARHGAVALSLFEQNKKTEARLIERLKALGWREAAPRVWAP